MKEKQTNQKDCYGSGMQHRLHQSIRCRPMYSILLLEGSGKVSVDLVEYIFEGKIALFTTPYQIIHFKTEQPIKVRETAISWRFLLHRIP